MTLGIISSVERDLTAEVERLRCAGTPGGPDEAFIARVLPRLERPSEVEVGRDRFSTAPALAAAGHRLAAGARLPSHAVDPFAEALRRLRARDALPADRESFFFRPVELLGIVEACAHAPEGSADAMAWARALLASGRHRASLDDPWSAALFLRAWWTVGSAERLRPACFDPPRSPREQSLTCWLAREMRVHAALLASPEDAGRYESAVLQHRILNGFDDATLCERAVHLAVTRDAVEAWAAVSLAVGSGRDAADVVVGLCRKFPLFARQMQTRHAARPRHTFNDEYDVQDALHALLRLHFADVRAEEWTPSYAATSSRMDFIIERESLVVEVKMTREGLGAKKVISELSEDKERYRRHLGWKTLVCFVFDPDLRLPNPDAIEADVSEEFAGRRVIAVVAPKGT